MLREEGTGLRWNDGELNPISRSNPQGVNNLDWRGRGDVLQDAVVEWFRSTGFSKDEFSITDFGRDRNGQSFPVEWTGPQGAVVNIDAAHYGEDRRGQWVTGPDAPHVGWKYGASSKQVGHILLDDAPYNR